MQEMKTRGQGERRKALLVIHGVGGQPPYRVLGAFVEGLSSAIRRAPTGAPVGSGGSWPTEAGADDPPAGVMGTTELGGKRRAYVRLPLAAGGEAAGEVDVYEYHWAEHPVGKISAGGTLMWLFEVLLAGLDFRRQLPFLMAGLPRRNVWPLVLRQLLQVLSLVTLAGLLLTLVLLLPTRAGELREALRGAGANLTGPPTVLEVAGLLLLASLLAVTALLTRDLLLARIEAATLRRRHASVGSAKWAGMYAAVAKRWAVPGFSTLALALLATGLVARLLSAPLQGYLAAAATLLTTPSTLIALAAAALLLTGRRLLLSHVAGVALYVTSDRVSSRARTRRAILDEGEELLTGLLGADYDGVYLAGHSLGSLIALDLLDRLSRGALPEASAAHQRVKGLLTFGSPLDKVAYFFRQRPGEGEAVRAQLLNYLHGVRRRPDPRDHGPFTLQSAPQPFERMEWLQVHAPGDLLSDQLLHYRVSRRVVLRRFNPLTAHNDYLRDEAFFDAALEWLKPGGEPVP